MTEVSTCVLRVGGTNCDVETERTLNDFEGIESEVVRINQLGDGKDLMDYDSLVIPGGFSYGDHVRAGSVFAKSIKTGLGEKILDFAEKGRPILGICNGFQVLVEAGLLPGFEGVSEFPNASLAKNESAHYECRWVHLKNDNKGNCVFTREIEGGRNIYMPVAHAEGRFILEKEREEEFLKRLERNDQIVLRYSDENGNYADGKYPENPNGSLEDIAGICDPSGKIFGLMPHPERAYYGFQRPDWTREEKTPEYADGRMIFESMAEYLKENFS